LICSRWCSRRCGKQRIAGARLLFILERTSLPRGLRTAKTILAVLPPRNFPRNSRNRPRGDNPQILAHTAVMSAPVANTRSEETPTNPGFRNERFVAAYLDVSVETLRAWRRRGRGPGFCGLPLQANAGQASPPHAWLLPQARKSNGRHKRIDQILLLLQHGACSRRGRDSVLFSKSEMPRQISAGNSAVVSEKLRPPTVANAVKPKVTRCGARVEL
jgi:hypothetical protein